MLILQIWLVGDVLTKEEQQKASKGTVFIPISQFPPVKTRKDCVYYNTPSMLAPKHLENVDSCEVSTLIVHPLSIMTNLVFLGGNSYKTFYFFLVTELVA